MNDTATILAVDDTPESLALLATILTQAGCQVRPADSGELALAAVAANPPDLILLDVRMEGVDGLEVCRRLKAGEETRHIPIILVSAFADVGVCVEGLQLGAADYITKPFRPEELLARVRTHLSLSRANISLEQQAAVLRQSLDQAEHSRLAMLRTLEDRKRAEVAMRALSSRQEAILSAIPDIVTEVDCRKVYTWANRAAVEFFGEDIIGKEAAFFFEGERDTYRTVQPLFDGDERVIYVESRQRRKDGEERLLAWWCKGLKDAHGHVTGALSTARDITERKQAEEALSASELRYRRLFEAAKDGILILDAETGKIVDANPFLCKLLGHSREELLGERLWEIGQFKDVASSQEAFAELQAKEYVRYEDLPLETKDGRRIDVEFVSNVYLVNRHKVIQCNIRDITERKQLEGQKESLKAQLANALEMAHLGHWELDVASGIFTFNDQFYKIFRTTADEVGGYTMPAAEYARRFVHPDDLHLVGDETRKAIEADDPCFSRQVEHRMLYADGTVGHMGVRFFIVKDAQGRTVKTYGVNQDITERKRAEQDREKLRAQLLHSQKLQSIGTLASGVAHEINNPINGVMNYAQLILDATEKDSPLREYAGEIVHETERVAAIVRDLLQFARQEKQGHSPARVQDIVDGTLSLIRTVMRHDQITLQVEVPEDLPPVECRSQQIQQVLMNLLTNARDALNARYPGYHEEKVIRVTAGAFDREERPWVRITVEDHGGGIAPEAQGQVFDPFFTTKPRHVGTGLGLSISHGIAKEHGGELRFETEPGLWTRFRLELPSDGEGGADA